ncbi:MAG: ASCH domain-containing protein [Specibacter sp.]
MGERQLVVDSNGEAVAVIEITEVRQVRLADVDLNHARDEGEGYTSVAQWRAGHEEFWHSADMREAMGDPNFDVDDDTMLVLERFALVARTWHPRRRAASLTPWAPRELFVSGSTPTVGA